MSFAKLQFFVKKNEQQQKLKKKLSTKKVCKSLPHILSLTHFKIKFTEIKKLLHRIEVYYTHRFL